MIDEIYNSIGRRELGGLDDRIGNLLMAWDTATGNRFHIAEMLNDHVRGISTGDVAAAKRFYCLISPFLFFIAALREIARKSYRNTVTQCGMFCERIVRNILQELPSSVNGASNMYVEMMQDRDHPSTFEDRAGRAKSELAKRHCDSGETLYNSLKNIYNVRNKQGPHDVPPPETIQARICVTESLPVYINYLTAMSAVGVAINQQDFDKFMNLFYALTEMKPSLVIGEETEQPKVDSTIIELYKQNFFSTERLLPDILAKLRELRYNPPKTTVANTLTKLSSGKGCLLSRRKTSQGYAYAEKIPPNEAFKSTF